MPDPFDDSNDNDLDNDPDAELNGGDEAPECHDCGQPADTGECCMFCGEPLCCSCAGMGGACRKQHTEGEIKDYERRLYGKL